MDVPVYKQSPLFRACAAKRAQRGKQYNTDASSVLNIDPYDYHPMGHASYAQMMWVKSLRLLVEVTRASFKPDHALVEEHIIDLVNYLCFWYEGMTGKRVQQ